MFRQFQTSRIVLGILLALLAVSTAGLRAEANFTGLERATNGIVLKGFVAIPEVYPPYTILYGSSDLQNWREIARLHNSSFFRYLHLSEDQAEYFRFEARGPGPKDDWSNQIGTYNEPFASHGFAAEMPYVKPSWED